MSLNSFCASLCNPILFSFCQTYCWTKIVAVPSCTGYYIIVISIFFMQVTLIVAQVPYISLFLISLLLPLLFFFDYEKIRTSYLYSVCDKMVYFQESSRNRIKLLDDDKEDLVNNVAEQLGLCPIGWIFTDLIADDLKKATVKHFRGNSVSNNNLSFLVITSILFILYFFKKYNVL